MKSHILVLKARHDWAPPAELSRSRPRRVVLTKQGKALVLVSALLLAAGLAAGVGLGLVVSRDQRNALLLQQQGLITDATVTRVWRNRDKERQPRIAYRFDVDGRTYARNIDVPLRFWTGLEPGSQIVVRYAASRPDLNHPAAVKFDATPVWVPFVVSFMIAVWAPLALLPIRHQWLFLTDGRAAPAIVRRHGDMQRSQHGSKLGRKYFYDLRQLSGATASGSAGPAKEPPPVGANLTVLYDPENPRRNTPYPFATALARISNE